MPISRSSTFDAPRRSAVVSIFSDAEFGEIGRHRRYPASWWIVALIGVLFIASLWIAVSAL
jgi:hypothetical protein